MTEPSQYFKGRTVQEQMNEVIGYVDTRAAEVATTAIAADVAQVHQDMLDADADASAAAASAAAAAGTLANAVKKTGEASQSIAGDIAVAGNLSGGSVTVPTPVNNTDAANKKYVDDQNALDVHLAGDQTVADVKTFTSSPVVPTVATGSFDTKAANGTKLKNELDNYPSVIRNTGNIKIAGNKQFQDAISRGCTSADMMANPTTSVGATVLSLVDLMQGDMHNSIGSMTKVRNTANQNYFDIQSTSYGFSEGGVQQRMDIFLRLLINDSTGDVQLILYRSKKNADGTGTTDIKSKVLAQITAAGVIT